MSAAHKARVYHRDLKPDNILVRRVPSPHALSGREVGSEGDRWEVRVIDFGLAVRQQTAGKSILCPPDARSASDRSYAGTFKYAPPEQKNEVDPISGKIEKVGPYSDVYTFGKTFCEALFGTTAPKGFHYDKLPENYQPLRDLLERCTADAVEERFADFGEVLAKLDALDPRPWEGERSPHSGPAKASGEEAKDETPGTHSSVPATLTSVEQAALRDLLDKSPRFFICNTNRRHSSVEDMMRQRKYAAAWETFAWPAHMQQVREGDAIFMWGKGAGIIAIGRATGRCETLAGTDPDRIRSPEEHPKPEWRIPVEWLIWVEDRNACPCDEMGNCSFKNVSKEGYRELRDRVRKHFKVFTPAGEDQLG